MAKYSKYGYKQVKERRWEVHPIWRGIGCVFIALIPIMSYTGAVMMVRANLTRHWVPIPAEYYGGINLAQIYAYLPVVRSVLPKLGMIYYADLLLMGVLLIIGFGALSVLYSLLYRVMGAEVHSPVDAPPIRKSPRKSSR
ncbi:MAG: hypothetical protein EHM70_15445 [Chloroflexota bacterium]|nr:MAG: hypothetical protein EHM70_15445 [Chloroflexota bacterium]